MRSLEMPRLRLNKQYDKSVNFDWNTSVQFKSSPRPTPSKASQWPGQSVPDRYVCAIAHSMMFKESNLSVMHCTYLSYFQSGLVTLIKSWVCFSFLASGPSSLYIYAGLVFFLPSILLRWICSSTTIENRKVLKFRIICCTRYFPSSQFKCAAMTSWTGVGEFFMCNSLPTPPVLKSPTLPPK